MPYIAQKDRVKFNPSILLALGILNDENSHQYLKGEYFGFFVNRIARRFLGDVYAGSAFNSNSFDESKRKSLENAADTISVALSRADPMSSAGELNYCISAVYWGFIGDNAQTNYGMRAYLNGILDKICSSIETIHSGSQKDATMAFRRHLVIRGVLDHVKAETYRRKTAVYEDSKGLENGDIWDEGKLIPES